MAEEPEKPEETEETPDAPVEETTAPDEPVAAEETPAEEPAPAEEPVGEETPPAEEAPAPAEEAPAEEAAAPAAEEPVAEEPPPAEEAPAPAEEAPAEEAAAPAAEETPAAPEEAPAAAQEAPRVKPEIPGADLEVDIVPEGVDPLTREEMEAEEAEAAAAAEEADEDRPVAQAAIDLAADARYRATGKRKTAIARVTLKPGSGDYKINGRELNVHFPRDTLERNIRQPLEAVGYESRMDVVATLHGGGTSAQAGALRHGIARALIEADPNLRGELKRRGFLTRDPRKKERKKAGLKKARKRPQFSKR